MITDIFQKICRSDPERNAVIDKTGSFTYHRLFLLTQLFAEHLVINIGVEKGDKIAICLPNCLEFIFSFFANAWVGAISVPLNIHLKENELSSFFERFDISRVITTRELAPRFSFLKNRFGKNRIIEADRLRIRFFEEEFTGRVGNGGGPLSGNPSTGSPNVLWLSTSGTTGKPRLVSKSVTNVIENANNVEKAIGITSRDKFFGVVPFYHANGFSNCMFLPVTRGAAVIAMEKFSARDMLKRIHENQATIVFGSPFIFSVLSDIVDESCRLPSVRAYITTGASLSPTLAETFRIKFGKDLWQLYGSTETGTISIHKNPSPELTLGKPLENVRVKILSETGAEVSSGATGEIAVKSSAVTKGYIDEPEMNARVFHNGFFRTGDMGFVDLHGNIQLSGRKKRVINAAGVKIDPVEVENVLLSHPKVKEVLVQGVKNKRGMEIIKAILVADSDCKVTDVIGHCRHRLADFKIPRIVEFKSEIPKNLMGKISNRQ